MNSVASCRRCCLLDEMRVECRRRVRGSNGQEWETRIYYEREEVLLQSIGLTIAIEELYRGVS